VVVVGAVARTTAVGVWGVVRVTTPVRRLLGWELAQHIDFVVSWRERERHPRHGWLALNKVEWMSSCREDEAVETGWGGGGLVGGERLQGN